jgi:hypothetical protein
MRGLRGLQIMLHCSIWLTSAVVGLRRLKGTPMNAPWDPWLDLSAEAVRLGHESGDVIGLRLAVAGRGGADAQAELCRMISEKALAALDAHFVVAGSLLAGEAHLAPARALALYRRRVQANRFRLSQEA